MLRGPVPTWWAPLSAVTSALYAVTALIATFGVAEVALVTGALGLIGFVIVTVVYFRAPRLSDRP